MQNTKFEFKKWSPYFCCVLEKIELIWRNVTQSWSAILVKVWREQGQRGSNAAFLHFDTMQDANKVKFSTILNGLNALLQYFLIIVNSLNAFTVYKSALSFVIVFCFGSLSLLRNLTPHRAKMKNCQKTAFITSATFWRQLVNLFRWS